MMNYKPNTKLPSFAGYTALLGGILASVSAAIGLKILTLITADPAEVGLLALPAGQVHLVAWSFGLSCLGNYLLLTPFAVFLSQDLREQKLARRLLHLILGVCGLGYLLLGAAGAFLLGTSWPESITDYQAASAQEQGPMGALILHQQHQLESIYHGRLQNCLGAIWFIGVALVYNPMSKPLALLTWLLALALAGALLGDLAAAPLATQLGMAAGLLLMPIWALLLGYQMCLKRWRRSPDAVTVPEITE